MRLEKIRIKNFLGINFHEFEMDSLVIFAGANFSGKTTVADAISLAMLGQPCRGVVKKKDVRQLVAEGAKSGEVVIDWSDDDGPKAVVRTIPDMRMAGPVPTSAILRFVLNMADFSALTPADRQTELMLLQGNKVDLADIKARAIKRGCTLEVVDKVAVMALTSFEAAENDARERARTAKAQWRAVTKEAWGATKAVGWEAPATEDPSEYPDPAELQAEADKIAKGAADVRGELRGLDAMITAETQRVERLVEMELACTDVPDLVAKELAAGADLEIDKRQLDAAEKALAEAQAKTRFYLCPCCDAKIIYDRGLDVMVEYTGTVDAAVSRKEIPVLKRNVQAAQDKVRIKGLICDGYNTGILDARAAEKAVDELRKGGTDIDVSRDNAIGLQRDIKALDAEGLVVQNRLDAVILCRRVFAESIESTGWAEYYNRQVAEWTHAADVFGPEGIPLEIVNETLESFNKALAWHADNLGWAVPSIRNDMEVMQAARPYQLLSRSEKWRVDAILSVVLAEISGLGVVVLDEFDILEPAARAPAMGWLHGIEIQTIVLMTAKKPPVELPRTRVHWLGDY